jgi:hypothetical protein
MSNPFQTEIKYCMVQTAAVKAADNNDEKYQYLSRFYGSKSDYEYFNKRIIQDVEIYDQPSCEAQLLRAKANQIEIKDFENALDNFEKELKSKGWLQ